MQRPLEQRQVLARITGKTEYETWYRTFWDFVSDHFIDYRNGAWYPQLDRDNRPTGYPWKGKPEPVPQPPGVPVAPHYRRRWARCQSETHARMRRSVPGKRRILALLT